MILSSYTIEMESTLVGAVSASVARDESIFNCFGKLGYTTGTKLPSGDIYRRRASGYNSWKMKVKCRLKSKLDLLNNKRDGRGFNGYYKRHSKTIHSLFSI
jgi:hypothetical protein